MSRDPAADGALLVLTIKAALSPVLERVAEVVAELKDLRARVDDFAGVRDRLVTVETKAAMPDHERVGRLAAMDALIATLRDQMDALDRRVSEMGAEKSLTDLRDRLVVMETKAAMPAPVLDVAPPVDLTPMLERVAKLEATVPVVSDVTRDVGTIRERLAVMESRPLVPGPPGDPGPPGQAGKDGDARLPYEGVYQEGKTYERSQLVTWGGSMWHCNAQTTTKPGDGSKDWTLVVKRGRDGRDGLDAKPLAVVAVK